MTDAIAGLMALRRSAARPSRRRWPTSISAGSRALVINKWFAVQARDPSEGALGRVLGLTAHPAFDAKTPNRLRALVGGFSVGNPARFHDPSGGGYRFLADQILAVDAGNPMTAARLIDPLTPWRRYHSVLAELMQQQLRRIAATGVCPRMSTLATRPWPMRAADANRASGCTRR